MDRQEKRNILNAIFLGQWHPWAWIFLGCFALYLKTLAFKFTYFDDNTLILNNFWFLKDFRNIAAVFKQTVFLGDQDFFFRPLLLVSFIINAHLGGTSPAVYHFTNILLHAAASSFVFVLFGRIGYGRRFAFAASMLFMVHPALSQAVAWIPGRNDSLLALFVLMSLCAFIDYGNGRGARTLLLHLLCFNLALYTKETAFQLVPLCLLYVALVGKSAFSGRQWRMLAAGWLASGAVWFSLRSATEAAAMARTLSRYDIAGALADMPLSLLQYAGKILFPFNLSGFPISQDTGWVYGALALIVLAAAFAATDRARKRTAAWGLLWFLLFILPPFILPDMTRLEHRLYLPMIGVFIMLGEFARSHAAVFSRKRYLAAAGMVMLLFSGISFVHSDIFIGRLPFWEDAARTTPHSSRVHNSLGVRYVEYGRKDLAEREFVKAIQLMPGNVSALVNFAGIAIENGKYDNADKALALALRLQPREYFTWYNLGLLRYLQGRTAEARSCWEKTLECNPDYFYAYRTLAVFHYLRGDPAAGGYLEKCRDTFGRPVTIPAGATLDDRAWLYRFSLAENG